MKKFDIFAGLKEDEIEFEKGLEFPSYEDALRYAEYLAYDLYYLNPKRDILEIELAEGVSEDRAQIIFITEMIDSVSYTAREAEGE